MTQLLVTLLPLSLALLPLSIGLVQHYASPGTSLSIRLLVVLSFWLGFMGMVLLPIDLTLAANASAGVTASDTASRQQQQEQSLMAYQQQQRQNQGQQQQQVPNATYHPWLVTYWSTFVLAWLILPPIRKALQSGHFTPYTRIRDAICSSLRLYIILSTALIICIICLAIHLRSWHVIPILMALGNTYGLLLVALLLGYGLVDVPRKLWRRGGGGSAGGGALQGELRRVQILANVADESLFEVVWSLQDVEDEIDSVVHGIHSIRRHRQQQLQQQQQPCDYNNDMIVISEEEMEMDGTMTYDDCVHELIRRRNLTAILSAPLQRRRTKRCINTTSTTTSASTTAATNGNGRVGSRGVITPPPTTIKALSSSSISPRSNGGSSDDGDNNDVTTTTTTNGSKLYYNPPPSKINGGGINGKKRPLSPTNSTSSTLPSTSSTAATSITIMPSITKLAELNAQLKQCQARLVSAEQNWNEIVHRWKFLMARVHGDYTMYEPLGCMMNTMSSLTSTSASCCRSNGNGSTTMPYHNYEMNGNDVTNYEDLNGNGGGGGRASSPLSMSTELPTPLPSSTSPRPPAPPQQHQGRLITKCQSYYYYIIYTIRYYWIMHLLSPMTRILAILCAILSCMVLWSEATMSFSWKNVSPFAWFLNKIIDCKNNTAAINSSATAAITSSNTIAMDQESIWFALAALLPLLYMSACVYSSLFKISFFGPHCLRGYKQCHGVALIFNAQYLIRMQFPLGYNYLLMLRRYDDNAGGGGDNSSNSGEEDNVSATFSSCAFSKIMHNMSTVPFFGTSFSVYAPLIILALCGFTVFDGYPRLLALLGLDHEDAILLGDRETLDRQVNEGNILLRRYADRSEGNSSHDGSSIISNDSGGGTRKISSTSIRADESDVVAADGSSAGGGRKSRGGKRDCYTLV